MCHCRGAKQWHTEATSAFCKPHVCMQSSCRHGQNVTPLTAVELYCVTTAWHLPACGTGTAAQDSCSKAPATTQYFDCLVSFKSHARRAQQAQLGMSWRTQLSPISLVLCQSEPLILNVKEVEILTGCAARLHKVELHLTVCWTHAHAHETTLLMCQCMGQRWQKGASGPKRKI